MNFRFGAGVSSCSGGAGASFCADFDRARSPGVADLGRAGSSGMGGAGIAGALGAREGLLFLGAGATATSSEGPALGPLGPAPTRGFSAGAGVGPAEAPELDAVPLVREALLLLVLSTAGVSAGVSAGGATAAGGACLPLNLDLALPLVSAAFAASSRLVNGGGARFSGIGAGSSFGADFAFKSRAAFGAASSAALIFALSVFANLLLILLFTNAVSAFLILPLPDDGGGGPSGGGAIPAGVSGGPGFMCNTNSFFAP